MKFIQFLKLYHLYFDLYFEMKCKLVFTSGFWFYFFLPAYIIDVQNCKYLLLKQIINKSICIIY